VFVNGLNARLALYQKRIPRGPCDCSDTLGTGRGSWFVGPLRCRALAAKYSFHAAIGSRSIYFLDIGCDAILDPRTQG